MQVVLPKRNFEDVAAARFALTNSIKPEGILFGDFDADPSIVGKTLAQVAEERKADPAELYLALIRQSIAEDADESIIGTSMRDDDIATLMRWSHANICSDGAIDGAHPRGAGSFTRVLRKYVREDEALSLHEAIHRMTGQAAAHMGFADRGYLKPGLVADLVLFDPATVSDHATTKDPRALSTGITSVWVSGELVWDGGKATGKRPGRALLREQIIRDLRVAGLAGQGRSTPGSGSP
jgi:N-acyl-D-amino-acid deacylase